MLKALRAANIARHQEWTGGQDVAPTWRGNELAGEAGEACNVLKKLERERRGWPGSRATPEQLAEELADVIICADLAAMDFGLDLEAAVAAKFNATSEKVGLKTRIAATTPAADPAPVAAGGETPPPAPDVVRELYEALRDCLSRFTEAFPASADYEPIKRGYAALSAFEAQAGAGGGSDV